MLDSFGGEWTDLYAAGAVGDVFVIRCVLITCSLCECVCKNRKIEYHSHIRNFHVAHGVQRWEFPAKVFLQWCFFVDMVVEMCYGIRY
jgi:hypothetical protein